MHETTHANRNATTHATTHALARRIGRAALVGLAGLVALAPAACSIFDRSAPSATHFLLVPPPQAKAEGAPLGSVIVRRASVVNPYDVRGFVYRLANSEWRIDAYNGFIAEPADMITDALMRGFERSGRFGVVAGLGLAASTDLAAETLVEEFFVDFSPKLAKPTAMVHMRTLLVDRRSGRGGVLATLRAHAEVPLADGSPQAVCDALSLAVGQAVAQVVAQLPADASHLTDPQN